MSKHTYELFGIDLRPNTSTHGPCQVKGCELEWTSSRAMTDFDKSKADRMTVCLCNGNSRLLRKLSEIDYQTLASYREELQYTDQDQS